MKEAYGGIFNLIFISIFLVVAIGVLGLTFSYIKAFKMKNAVIETIEEYEGDLTNSNCSQTIENKAKGLAYSPISDCSGLEGEFYLSPDGYYCYQTIKGLTNDTLSYKVVVQVDIHFPLMERITGFSIFRVSGDTKTIRIRKK